MEERGRVKESFGLDYQTTMQQRSQPTHQPSLCKPLKTLTNLHKHCHCHSDPDPLQTLPSKITDPPVTPSGVSSPLLPLLSGGGPTFRLSPRDPIYPVVGYSLARLSPLSSPSKAHPSPAPA